MEELTLILEKFAASGWDLLAVPARLWLEERLGREELRSAIAQADEECGRCGCELDSLYRRVLELLQ